MGFKNLCGMFDLSMSSKNEESEIYCNALLIALLPVFQGIKGSPYVLTI